MEPPGVSFLPNECRREQFTLYICWSSRNASVSYEEYCHQKSHFTMQILRNLWESNQIQTWISIRKQLYKLFSHFKNMKTYVSTLKPVICPHSRKHVTVLEDLNNIFIRKLIANVLKTKCPHFLPYSMCHYHSQTMSIFLSFVYLMRIKHRIRLAEISRN